MTSLVIVATGVVMFGCSEDNYNSKYDCYLSIEAGSALDSPENAAIIREAVRRMDSYVSWRGGEFRSGGATAAKLTMSEELFDMLLSMMGQTNDMLREMSEGGSRLVEVKSNTIRVVDREAALLIPKTRGLGEDALPPGSDGWDARWYGVDVYLSSHSLATIANYGGAAVATTAIAAALGAGAPGWVISGAIAAVSSVISQLAVDCPNGAIVRLVWPVNLWVTTGVALAGASCQ